MMLTLPTGTLPSCWGQLTALRVLKLSDTMLGGATLAVLPKSILQCLAVGEMRLSCVQTIRQAGCHGDTT